MTLLSEKRKLQCKVCMVLFGRNKQKHPLYIAALIRLQKRHGKALQTLRIGIA